MKKALAFLCVFTAFVFLFSCSVTETEQSKAEQSKEESPIQSEIISEETGIESSEESKEMSEEKNIEVSKEEKSAKAAIPEGAKVITNLDYTNTGRMGDNDGPAYVVYSKKGYNKASMDIAASRINTNTVREDKRYVNGYMFLGCDIYNGSSWANCFDTGFCRAGRTPYWHLFYNIYETANKDDKSWYESSVRLSDTHDYRLILDTSEEDKKATVTIWDLTDDKKVDEVSFYVKGMKSDGSNTAYLMNFALDYPNNVRKDRNGNDSEDWSEITLYNTDENLYMQNILVSNVKIYKSGEEFVWDESRTSCRSLWPDATNTAFDYACTKVIGENYDYEYRVDLDMNR